MWQDSLSIGNLPTGSGEKLQSGKYHRMANRIREVRKQQNITLEQLAEMTDISSSNLSRMESSKRGLSLENAIRISKALNVEVVDISDEFDPSELAALPSDFDKSRPTRRQKTGDIPNFTIHAGMGPGGALSVLTNQNGDIYNEHSNGFWSFPDAVKAGWRQLSKVYAMPVTGDSMEPTLPGGSFVFVDTSHTTPSPEDIYAIDFGDGLMIKRVKLIPRTDKVLIISDNERYGSDELLRDDVTVYGRVVAWFQWRG